jgi:hypothetical protein
VLIAGLLSQLDMRGSQLLSSGLLAGHVMVSHYEIALIVLFL